MSDIRSDHGGAAHRPVLLAEALAHLAVRPGGTYVDATFGAGGHTSAILATDGATVHAIDRDPQALAIGAALRDRHGARLHLHHGRFSDMERLLGAAGVERVDGVLMDIGVSSMQLDQAARGFSFLRDGPLDMRMGGDGPRAADVVNSATEKELADILWRYGEERRARAIARAIVGARRENPIDTTGRLAAIVEEVLGRPRQGAKHPATRTFQALRIHVNDELGELAAGLAAAERLLKPGGRLVVITFHSLEDRLVKRFIAERSRSGAGGSRHLPPVERPAPSFIDVAPGGVTPSTEELRINPRARSARLRAAERTDAPAHDSLDPRQPAGGR